MKVMVNQKSEMFKEIRPNPACSQEFGEKTFGLTGRHGQAHRPQGGIGGGKMADFYKIS